VGASPQAHRPTAALPPAHHHLRGSRALSHATIDALPNEPWRWHESDNACIDLLRRNLSRASGPGRFARLTYAALACAAPAPPSTPVCCAFSLVSASILSLVRASVLAALRQP